MIKNALYELLNSSLQKLSNEGTITTVPDFKIEAPRQPEHGDYACNVALILAKQLKANPRETAEKILQRLPESEDIADTEIAGPGYINFFIADKAYHHIVQEVLDKQWYFGRAEQSHNHTIHLEFISANPTGPLHVGHGRNAAYGASLGNLLQSQGYEVFREYYVNDAGRQIGSLALSIWLRYLSFYHEQCPFPEQCYHGRYIIDIAHDLRHQYGECFHADPERIFQELTTFSDPNSYVDELIKRMKAILGDDLFRRIANFGVDTILHGIQQDLAHFGVHYQRWFRESQLVHEGAIEHGLQQLRDHHCLYEKDNAVWFISTHYGDSKDRVVIRENNQSTYFASDIAYHLNKLERGYHQLIDVLGADHHGYVPRIQAFLQALDGQDRHLTPIIVQFATLYRNQQKISMSTRGGQFVTLRQLCDEVGTDAARYFYVRRKPDQHMDFDLELAKSQSTDNPVYYIQYAHARIASIHKQLAYKQLDFEPQEGVLYLYLLDTEHEQNLMRRIARYPEVLQTACQHYAPHELANYLEQLAMDFHTYYNAYPFIVEEYALRNARLALIESTRQVLYNGLELLGVSAPEAM